MKAFIFDMDGVIIDSEPMHNATLAEIMKEYDIDADDKYLFTFSGLNINAMFYKIKKEKAYEYSLQNSWEKVKKDYYKLWKV